MAQHVFMNGANDHDINIGIMYIEDGNIVYMNRAALQLYDGAAPKTLADAFDAGVCRELAVNINENRSIHNLESKVNDRDVFLSMDTYPGEAAIRIHFTKPVSQWESIGPDVFSKEMKTPLQILMMTISTLANEKNEFIRAKYLASMMHSCYRITRMVNNMNELMLSGHIRFSPKSADLVAWLREETDVLNQLDFLYHVDIGFDTQLVSLQVNVDLDLISRAVMHLISNSIRHGKADRITINLSSTSNHAIITVTDNGRGIPGDILASMPDSSQDTKGLGLGLRAVERIAQKHDGSLVILADKDEGADVSFTVSLHIAADTILKSDVRYESGSDPCLVELSDVLSASLFRPEIKNE